MFPVPGQGLAFTNVVLAEIERGYLLWAKVGRSASIRGMIKGIYFFRPQRIARMVASEVLGGAKRHSPTSSELKSISPDAI